MIYLKLFFSFLKIGAFTFGGGYAMISIIRETVLSYGWMTESELLNFIAVAESTPGPIAVNMATFIGNEQAGILGSILATVGVILPSFIIILIIASLISNLLKLKTVNAFLSGVRPCVVAMIMSTALTLGLSTIFSFKNINSTPSTDTSAIIIFVILITTHNIFKKIYHKKPSPILMIILSAMLGMLMYK